MLRGCVIVYVMNVSNFHRTTFMAVVVGISRFSYQQAVVVGGEPPMNCGMWLSGNKLLGANSSNPSSGGAIGCK